MRRSKPREKPARKKCSVDKYFRSKKPHIYPKTGKYVWLSPYQFQQYKYEFIEGPYSSDIDSSKDELTTGQHELNTINFAKRCKECQTQKKPSSRYGWITPKSIAENEMTPWNTVYIDLIFTYTVKVKHNQLGGTIKEVYLHLTCMTFIDPSTG